MTTRKADREKKPGRPADVGIKPQALRATDDTEKALVREVHGEAKKKIVHQNATIDISTRPTVLKVAKQGNSTYVRLTKDITDRYHLEPGDEVHAVETPDGLMLRQYDPEFSRKLKAYQRTAKKFRNTLRELAK